MTEDASPENLRKFMESDDPAMVRMGLSMAKGAEVSGEILGEILWMYMFHDDKTIRAAAKSTFIKIAPEDAKRAVKESWKAEHRKKPTEHDRALSSLIRGLKRTPVKVVKPLFGMFGPLPAKTWQGQIGSIRWESETTQLAASRALGELGTKNDEVCDFLLSKFGGSKKGIKEKIIISLGLTRNRKAIPVLKPLLKDKNPSFRKIVAEAMNNLNYKPEEAEDKLDLYIADRDWDSCVSLGEPAFDHLLKLLEGRGNKDIKPELCTTIGKFNDKRAIPILIKYTSSRDPSLLNSAALALGSMRAVEAVDVLIDAIRTSNIPRAGNDSRKATSRVEALGMIGDQRAFSEIGKLRGIVDGGMTNYSYGFNHYNLWDTHSNLLHSCEVSLCRIIEAQKGDVRTLMWLSNILENYDYATSYRGSAPTLQQSVQKALIRICDRKFSGKEKKNIVRFLKEDPALLRMGISMMKGILIDEIENIDLLLKSDDPIDFRLGLFGAKDKEITIENFKHFLSSSDSEIVKTGVTLANEIGLGSEAIDELCKSLSPVLLEIDDKRAVKPLIVALDCAVSKGHASKDLLAVALANLGNERGIKLVKGKRNKKIFEDMIRGYASGKARAPFKKILEEKYSKEYEDLLTEIGKGNLGLDYDGPVVSFLEKVVEESQEPEKKRMAEDARNAEMERKARLERRTRSPYQQPKAGGLMPERSDWAQKRYGNGIDWVSATKTRNFMNHDMILDWLDLYGHTIITDPDTDEVLDGCYEKDTEDKNYDANLDFVQLLFRKGHEFEYIVVNYLKNKFGADNFVTVGVNSADSKDPAKEQETLQHMKDGVPFILQGVLRNPDNKTYGMPDIMVRNDILSKIPENEEYQSFSLSLSNIDASSELGNYHYRIIDVKFTTLNYNADGTYLLGSDAHKAQLAIYNQALGRMQGFLPPEAYLLGRNWKRTKNGVEIHGEGALDRLGVVDFFNIDRDFIQKANDAVEWIRRVRIEGSTWEVMPKPTVEQLWPNCKNQSDYPWHNAKAKIADELNELTKVWQIGPRERERAHVNGIFGWNDPDLTPEKIGITGPKRVKIMREVLNINNQDKVKVLPEKIANNDRKWQKKADLEFFVDFETVSNIEDDFSNFPRQGGQELIFMIGCGFERNGKFEIEVFTAKNLSIEEEARIITEWFDYMEYVKNEILGPSAKLPNIFHWSPAELTFMGVAHNNLEGDEIGMLDKIYKDRKEMIENWKALPWFDFLKVMKDEPIVVKGAFGFGLKAIAKKLEEHCLTKTTWKDGPVDGLGAMVGAWYCDRISREQGIDMDRTELMQGIREYNIIDCKAMWDLINYLRKHHT